MTAAAAVEGQRARRALVTLRDAPDGTSNDQPALAPERSEGTSNKALNEATLHALWAGQRFPAAALVTESGELLRVLHPGRPGRGPGPDFRDALIAAAGGGTLRGDVELHVRAADFAAHGHDRDRRYDRVVLHLVFDAGGAGETALASGRRVPVVAIGRWARRRADELAAWLRSPSLWREPCHDAVARLGAEEVTRRLDALGEARLGGRQQSLADGIECLGAGEALYRALLAGLGYGGDRAAFVAVAETLPAEELVRRVMATPVGERVAAAETALLGAAGLLKAAPSDAEGVRPAAGGGAAWNEALPSDAEGVRHAAGGGAALNKALPSGAEGARPAGEVGPALRSSSRPANDPARRLAGLARLAVRHLPLLAGEPPVLPERTARLVADWTVAADGEWRRSPASGRPARRPLGALIGRARAIELLTNAVLPWAAALGDARAREALATLPAPGRYGSLAFLETNLSDGRRRPPLTARRQQGLLALYKTECTQGGCGRCPLS